MKTFFEYVMIPDRPASASPWSRTLAAVVISAVSASPLAPSSTSTSAGSRVLPSSARFRARRIAVVRSGATKSEPKSRKTLDPAIPDSKINPYRCPDSLLFVQVRRGVDGRRARGEQRRGELARGDSDGDRTRRSRRCESSRGRRGGRCLGRLDHLPLSDTRRPPRRSPPVGRGGPGRRAARSRERAGRAPRRRVGAADRAQRRYGGAAGRWRSTSCTCTRPGGRTFARRPAPGWSR